MQDERVVTLPCDSRHQMPSECLGDLQLLYNLNNRTFSHAIKTNPRGRSILYVISLYGLELAIVVGVA